MPADPRQRVRSLEIRGTGFDWESLEWKSTWKKFNVALRLRGKQELDRRSEISRAALAVNELRNAMTHFKPEWHHDLKKHKDVGDALAGFFVPNPTFANEPIFPRAWVGHSCTCWVVDSTVKFLQEFERLADLPKRTDWPALQGRLQA